MEDKPQSSSIPDAAAAASAPCRGLVAPNADELQHSVRGGARAVALGQLAAQLTALLVLSLLYRRLGADEFGLLGMAAPLIALAEMLSAFGLHVATIQRHQINRDELNAMFWWNMAFSALAAVVMAAAAAPLATLFAEPRLVAFCLALAGLPLVSSMVRMHRALLERQLRFARLTAVRFIAQLMAGAAAVAAAYAGWGAWSLLAQLYVDQLIFAVLLWRMHPWRPAAPSRGREHGELFRFSGLYAASALLFFTAQQADKVLLSILLGGMRGGTQAVGYYTQAYGLMMRPLHQICTPITSLMLPALSRAAPEQRAALCTDFFRVVGILLFPAGAGLTAVSAEVMHAMGGDSWDEAGRLLQWLAPILMVHGLISICGSVYAAVGRTDRLVLAAASLVLAILLGAGCGAGIGYAGSPSPGGLARGIAIGVATAFLLLTAPYVAWCLGVAGVSRRQVARGLGPAALAAGIMGVAVALANQLLWRIQWPPGLRISVLIPGGAISYAILARQELRWLVRRWMRSPVANDGPDPSL